MLGPAAYGNFEFTLALMTFFALSVDLGLSTYGAREIAKQRSRAAILLRDICLLRALLAAGLFAVLVLLVLLVEKNPEVKILLILYGVSLLGIPGLLHWFFQGHDLMHWVAVAQIIRQGVLFFLSLPDRPEPQPQRLTCVLEDRFRGSCFSFPNGDHAPLLYRSFRVRFRLGGSVVLRLDRPKKPDLATP